MGKFGPSLPSLPLTLAPGTFNLRPPPPLNHLTGAEILVGIC